MGIKDISPEPKRLSITYWEAIMKLSKAFRDYTSSERQAIVSATLAIIFERDPVIVVGDLIAWQL